MSYFLLSYIKFYMDWYVNVYILTLNFKLNMFKIYLNDFDSHYPDMARSLKFSLAVFRILATTYKTDNVKKKVGVPQGGILFPLNQPIRKRKF